MTFKGALLTTTVLAVAMTVSPAFASNKKPDGSAELEERVRQLEQQLQDMQIQMGSQIKEIQNKQNAVTVTIDNARPVITSGDGQFEAAIRGRMHFDAGSYYQDDNLPATVGVRDLGSGATMRRARLGLEGRAFRVFDYEMSVEFGGSGGTTGAAIEAFRLGYTGFGNGIRFDVGIFKPSMTLEHPTSSNEITFVERGAIINAMADAYGGAAQRQGVQLQWTQENLFYEGSNFFVSTAYTGNISGAPNNEGDNRSHNVGRAAWRIFGDNAANQHVQIGGSWGYVIDDGNAAGFQIRERPESRMDGRRLVDTGAITPAGGRGTDGSHTYGFEAAAQYENLFLWGEYYDMIVSRDAGVADAEFSGWYVAGSWVITGETKRYNPATAIFGAPRPNSPFVLGATTGAIELTARYSTLDLNHNQGVVTAAVPALAADPGIRGGEQTITTIGANWYLNRNVRFLLNHQFVEIDRWGNAANQNQSQDFQATVLRTQFAF